MGSMFSSASAEEYFGTGDLKFHLPDGTTLQQQSVETSTACRRAVVVKDGQLMEAKGVKTMYDNFKHGLEISKDANCLGWRPTKESPYTWLSYRETDAKIKTLSSALANLDLKKNDDGHACLGIYSVNCVEWVATSYGAYTQSIVVVPLYDTLGPEAVMHVVEQTGMQAVLCDSYKKVNGLTQVIGKLPTLKHVIVINDTPGEEKDKAMNWASEQSDVKLVTFADFEKSGQSNPKDMNHPQPDDLLFMLKDMGLDYLVGPNKCMISFLPLAHIFEHAMEIYMLYCGGAIGFYSGSVQTLMDDIAALQPTVFPLVPRLLSRLYDNITAKVAEGGYIKGAIFNCAYSSKLGKLKQGIITRSTIWDRVVFKDAQAKLGGKVELMVTGAAPIAGEVLEMCRVVLGCIIVEGYGQTECAAACSITLPGDSSAGHVGMPLTCNEIKLDDVPEMQYYAKDQKGEICIRGPNLMKGYYKEPGKTAETIDSDGWLHTGDVGTWLPNGTLKIIDRKKHIFKTAQGEYVAPEKIEQVYVRMPLIEQIFVDGISTQRYIIAIVVPDQPSTRAYVKEHLSLPADTTWSEICANESVRQHFQQEMTKFAKANKLNSIETVKAIHLCSEPFSIENDLLTPTMKSKRPNLRKHFSDVINRLYSDNPNL